MVFDPKTYFFYDSKLRAKFQNPRTTPSGRKVCGGEKKGRKKKEKSLWTPGNIF